MVGDQEQKERAPVWSDRKVDLAISYILRGGVITASILVITGGVSYLLAHGGDYPAVAVFHGQPPTLTSPSTIMKAALTGNGDAIIQSGVLILLATPFLRVAFSAFAFYRQRDRTYVVIALTVLAALTYGIFASHI